jgi:hypothetical protein
MPRKVSPGQVAGWSDARLRDEWSELQWHIVRQGYTCWEDMSMHDHAWATLLVAEFRRRGMQLSLLD